MPGCGSTGKTKKEVEQNIQQAIECHLEGLRIEGCDIPEPSSYSVYVEVAALGVGSKAVARGARPVACFMGKPPEQAGRASVRIEG